MYYKENNLNKLREVKSKYDAAELFQLKMSIPPLMADLLFQIIAI
ncbi:MAG: hypothetical protein COA88_13165 [Kordia sp.]|nr:MAG: hypothetical protein COA88_13165 [Kordia sp.]